MSISVFSRIRGLTLPKEKREAARAARRERKAEQLAAGREAAGRAESHSRQSGGFHQEWRG